MTHITFFRNDGIFYGFEERGHAGCGQFGNDPVCAMISSLTMYIVDAVDPKNKEKFEEYCSVFKKVMEEVVPDVAAHFEEKEVDLKVLLKEW